MKYSNRSKESPGSSGQNLQSKCMKEHFFEQCSSLDTQYETFKDIWRNMDEIVQLHCFEFLIGSPGLKSEALLEEYIPKSDFKLKVLRQILAKRKIFSIYQDDEDDQPGELRLFGRNTGYLIKFYGCGLVAKYPDKEYIPLNSFLEALEEIENMIQHKLIEK